MCIKENNMYKNISIELENNLNIEQSKIYNELDAFINDDFSFEFNENLVEIQLRALDFKLFDANVTKILSNGTLNQDSKEVIQKILDKISSIGSYGFKGSKRIYVDYDKERKVQNRKEKEAKRQQYFYAKDNNFSKINNELPAEYENKIICGDSKIELAKLPDNCIDLVITSPPYNFGLDYAATKDDSHWKNYFDKLFEIFKECIRVLKYGGRAIINVQPLYSDYIPTHHIISNFFIENKMIWKGEIMWEKNNYNAKYTAWGSWKSPSNPYLKYTWEFIEV